VQGCNPQCPHETHRDRILQLRQKIQDLRKPSNPIGERFAGYAIKQAEIELEHWFYFLGEDE
jgi:hypothetical protein